MSKSKEGHLAFYSLKARWDCSCEWTHKSSLVSRSKSVKKVSNHNCWNADRLLQPSCLGWTFCLKTARWINKTGLFLFSSLPFVPCFSIPLLSSSFFPCWRRMAFGCPWLGAEGESMALPAMNHTMFPYFIPVLCWHRQHGYWWLQGAEGMF